MVLLGPELEPVLCEGLHWEGERITRIDPLGPARNLPFAGPVVIPGLVNGHTHIADGLFPDGATGLTLEAGFFRPDGYKYRALSEAKPEAIAEAMRAIHGAMARGGTVCHLDFREQGLAGAQLLRAVSEKSGVRSIILSQFAERPQDAEELENGKGGLSPEELASLDALLDVADGFSESTMNDLTDPAWEQIRQVTEDCGKLRAVHCLENTGYRETSLRLTGKGDLERALMIYDAHLIVHLTVATPEEIGQLGAKEGIVCVVNPRANASLGLPLPPLRALLESGVPLLLGTDNVMLNEPDLFREMDFCWKILRSQKRDPRFPDPLEVLKMCTVNAGRLPGMEDFGFLFVVREATFCILDFSSPRLRRSRQIPASIVSRAGPGDVICTLRKGKLLYERKPDG